MSTIPNIRLNNGLEMPQLGFGTWQIFRNGKAENAVAEALKIGYRLIDTARIYTNEKGVGRAVREAGLRREEIFVTTKLWGNSNGYDKALKAFDSSLGRLGLDYVDLYLIHFPPRTQRIETWQALEEIYKSGRAQAIGVSNYDIGHVSEILDVCNVAPAVNQIELHAFNYKDQQPTVDFCKKQGIVLEAYSPLAQASQMGDPVIKRIAEKHHKSYAQVMLRWCIQQGTVPIPKSSNPQRIRENFDTFDFELATEDMQALDGLSK